VYAPVVYHGHLQVIAKGQQERTQKVITSEGACCHATVGDLAGVGEGCFVEHSGHVSVLCLHSNVQLDALETSDVEQVELVVQFATDIGQNRISSPSGVDLERPGGSLLFTMPGSTSEELRRASVTHRAHDLPRGEGQVHWYLRIYASQEDCGRT